MSRPYQMHCSVCDANITMEGSQICAVCTPVGIDPQDVEAWDKQEAKVNRQPLLCGTCFDREHGHHNTLIGSAV